jgi:hypothetical protein
MRRPGGKRSSTGSCRALTQNEAVRSLYSIYLDKPAGQLHGLEIY